MVVVKSIYDTNTTPSTARKSVGVIKPLVPTTSPILERKKPVVEETKTKPETSKKVKFQEGIERIKQTPIKEFFLPTASPVKGLIDVVKNATQRFGKEASKTVKVTDDLLKSQYKGTYAMLNKYASDAYKGEGVVGKLMSLPTMIYLMPKSYRKKTAERLDEYANQLQESAFKDLDTVENYLKENPLAVDASEQPFKNKITNPEWVARGLTLNAPSFLASLGTTALVTLATKNPVAGYTAGFGGAFALEGGDSYNEARRQGVDEKEARMIGTVVGGINGLLETIFPGKKVADLMGGKQIKKQFVKELTKEVITDMATEGGTEALQELVANVGKKIYDKNTDLLQGLPESAFFGALMGGVTSISTNTVNQLRNAGVDVNPNVVTSETVEEIEKPPEKVEEPAPEEKPTLETTTEGREAEKVQENAPETPKTYNYGGKELPITNIPTEELTKVAGEEPGGFRTAEELAELRASIEKSGIKIPVEVVRNEQGEIVSINNGIKRIRTAQELGIKEVPTITVKGEEPTVVKEKELEPGGVGYRVEEYQGSGVTNAINIIRYETKELGNEHIVKDVAKVLKVEPTLENVVKAIKEKFGENAEAVWLATKEDVKFYEKDSEGNVIGTANKQNIPKNAVKVSDLGKDGSLFIYSTKEQIKEKPQKVAEKKTTPLPSPTKKVSKKQVQKPIPSVKESVVTGKRIRSVPSVKVDKVHKVIVPKNPTLPMLANINVKDGKMMMTDLTITAVLNTDMKDGIYQRVGEDLIPLDPKLAEDYPNMPEVGETKAKILPENLSDALKDAMTSASVDDSRPILNGINVEIKGNKATIVSTDGFRLFTKQVGVKNITDSNFIVWGKKLSQLAGDVFKDGGAIDIGIDKEGNITFSNDNGMISVRKMEGDYPDYRAIYPVTDHRIAVNKKELSDAIKTLAPYAKTTANIVKMYIEPTELRLVADGRIDGNELMKEVKLKINDASTEEVGGMVEGTLIMPVKVEDKFQSVPEIYQVRSQGEYGKETYRVLDTRTKKLLPNVYDTNSSALEVANKLNVKLDKTTPKKPIKKVDIAFNYKFLEDAIKTLKTDDFHLSYKDAEKATSPFIVTDEKKTPFEEIDVLQHNIMAEIRHQRGTPEGVSVEKLVELFGDEAKVKKVMEKMGEKELTTKEKKLRKYLRSGTQANIDRFADLKSVADSEEYYKAIQFPEVVRMVRELLGVYPSVKYPRARPTRGGVPTGVFVPAGEGILEGSKIILNPDIFKSPEQAIKTLAHEVGHLADFMPEGTFRRGNLIGHIASLNDFLRKDFSGYLTKNQIDNLVKKQKELQETRRGLKAEGRERGTHDKEVLSELKNVNKQIKELRKNPKLVLDVVEKELKQVTQTWKPFDEEAMLESDPGYVEYRYSSPELYADAVSMLFNDPALLKQIAPTFWDGFFEAMDYKAEFKDAYFATLDLLNSGEEQILSEREKDLRSMFKKGEDLYRAKLEENKQKENDIVFRLKYELIDKNQAVIDRMSQLQKKGIAVADENNPVYFLEEGNYVGGVVKSWLEKNIQPIYADLKSNEVTIEDFGEVLFLERVIKERGGTRNPVKLLREAGNVMVENGIVDFVKAHKDSFPADLKDLSPEEILNSVEKMPSDLQLNLLKGVFGEFKDNPLDPNSKSLYDDIIQQLPKGLANPLGYDVETATKQLEYLKSQLGDKYNVIERNLPVFRKAIKSLIPQAYEAELYSEELSKQIIANPAYATFQVLDYLDLYIPASIKQQVGTLKEVSNPMEATILKSISTIRAIEKNKAKLSVIRMLKNNFSEDIKDAKTIWTGRFNLPIESKDSDWRLITVMENGRMKGYYVDPYIASIWDSAGTGRMNAVLSVLRFFNHKLFKPLFTTYNVGFQTFNLFRDFMRFYKNVPKMSFPRALIRYKQSLKPAIARAWDIPNNLITEMEGNKIFSVTYNDVIAGLDAEDKQIDFILQRYGLAKSESGKRGMFKIPLAIMDNIAKFGNAIETLPKVAGYIELQGKLPSRELASFIRTSVGSPDFLRKGAGYGWYNEVFLYSNAMKEGVRADLNVAFRNPKTRAGWWIKTAMFTILPKLVMYAGLLGLFGAGVRKMLEDASEYDRTNYTIIPLGIDENGRTVYMRVPQDETGRFIGGLFWKTINLTKEKSLSYSDIAEVLSYTGGQIPNFSPTLTATFATAQFLGGQNPYDFFRGRNVISDTEFKAGGKYALKPFLTWQFNNLGGGVFHRFYYTEQSPETETWVQKITQAPVISNILGRWIRVSDYGQKEANREILKETEQSQARETLRRREVLDKYVEMYREDKSKKADYQRQLVNEILGHKNPENSEEKTLVTNTLKKFNIAILRGEADPNLNSLIDANTNEEKLNLMRSFREELDGEKYKELVKTAKENKIFSEEFIEKLKQDEKLDKVSGVFDKVNDLLAKINLVSEVKASDEDLQLSSVERQGDSIVFTYLGKNGNFKIESRSIDNDLGIVGATLGQLIDSVGKKLGIKEMGASELFGYEDKEKRVSELLEKYKFLDEKTSNVIKEVERKVEPTPTESVKKEDKAYYDGDKVFVKGSGINDEPTETKVPEKIANTIKDIFGKEIALEAMRTLHHPREFTDIEDEQERGVNTGMNRGENPEFAVTNMDIPNGDGTIDRGLFRINSGTFDEMWNRTFNGITYPLRSKMKKIGINSYADMENLEKNVKMAKLIYDEGGWRRWYASPKDLRLK